jgi:hypothetical protein
MFFVKQVNKLQNLQRKKINKETGKVLKTSWGSIEVWHLVNKKRGKKLKTSPDTNDEIEMLSSDDVPFR